MSLIDAAIREAVMTQALQQISVDDGNVEAH